MLPTIVATSACLPATANPAHCTLHKSMLCLDASIDLCSVVCEGWRGLVLEILHRSADLTNAPQLAKLPTAQTGGGTYKTLLL